LIPAPLGHQLQVGGVIALVEERLLPTVAALRNVVRQAGNHYSCQSCHAANLTATDRHVNDN
jgi:hypothetical protein